MYNLCISSYIFEKKCHKTVNKRNLKIRCSSSLILDKSKPRLFYNNEYHLFSTTYLDNLLICLIILYSFIDLMI